MDRAELRRWVEDALMRHDRDAREREESVDNVTVPEIVEAVWGRLPLEIRRGTTPAQVQASLTMITLRRGIAANRPGPADPPDPTDPPVPPQLSGAPRS